jgi:membrane protease YdiL (CAAX protease family)
MSRGRRTARPPASAERDRLGLALGVNPVFPVAFVVGVLTALLFRWSGSIWPGVALHGMNNASALIVPLVLGVTQA